MPKAHRDDSMHLAELEAELTRLRSTLRSFFDRAPFGVHQWEVARDGELRFLTGNAAADRILGTEHARLVGQTMAEAFPPLMATAVPGAYRRVALEGGVYEDEQVSYRDDRIAGAYDIHAFQTEPGRMAVLFRDITERLRADAALRAKSEELDRYFTSSLDLLCIADTDGYFRRVNPEWERTLGWKVSDLVGARFLDLVHPDDLSATLGALSTLAAQREVLSFTNRYRCRDGAYRSIEWRSFPQGSLIYAVARDVTDRLRVETELRRSQERLQSIFRAAPVGIGVIVSRVMTEVNDRLCTMTGYAREELIGMSTRLLYSDDGEFLRVGRILEDEAGEQKTAVVEARWRRKDGEPIDVLLSTTLLATAGAESGRTFTALDVTAQRRADEERRRLEARMQHTQKLESLGVLAGGIAHDFNNILMAVLGHADLAQSVLSTVSPARENLQEIERAARRATDLCRQMLAYSGKGRFVVQPLDLTEVIQEMTEMLQVSVSKKAVLRLNLAKELPPVEADVAQLRQVVMNLVINASEAIGDTTGVISLSTGSTRCDQAYLAGSWMADELGPGWYVFLDVTDTGCGMDAETRSRIFEPFFTTKFTGRGLGLAAVIGIVRGHHGAIKVYSEVGRGSTFKVLLPASAQPVRHLSAPDPGQAHWRGSGRILLVDDEESIRTVAAAMLERLGFEVTVAANGREAVTRFGEAPEQFVCVLMDLTMPDVDGEEAYRELRGIRPDIVVLLSSGYNEQEAVQRFVGKGLAGFIQKPYMMSSLARKLKAVLTTPPAPRSA